MLAHNEENRFSVSIYAKMSYPLSSQLLFKPREIYLIKYWSKNDKRMDRMWTEFVRFANHKIISWPNIYLSPPSANTTPLPHHISYESTCQIRGTRFTSKPVMIYSSDLVHPFPPPPPSVFFKFALNRIHCLPKL